MSDRLERLKSYRGTKQVTPEDVIWCIAEIERLRTNKGKELSLATAKALINQQADDLQAQRDEIERLTNELSARKKRIEFVAGQIRIALAVLDTDV